MSDSNIDKTLISTLLQEYDTQHQEWLDAKANVEACYKKQSATVKKIFEANAGATKPKEIKRKKNGNVQSLTIVRRGESYFFRGDSSDDGEIIE